MGQEVLICSPTPRLVTSDNSKGAKESLSPRPGAQTRNSSYSGKNPDHVRELWRRADAVCFDVDSTVCQDEAIDELADFLGKGAEVKACTQRAMAGGISFRAALSLRLDIIRPSRQAMETYADTNPVRLTPGIRELIDELHAREVHVYLVSGGFRRLIEPVAEQLGIPRNRVYANELLFNEHGHYAGFSKSELTSDSGSIDVGKPGVCGLLKATHGYNTLLMVGDGATDAEACPPADGFIGFGGNQVRESVRQLSEWFVYDFRSLHQELFRTQRD